MYTLAFRGKLVRRLRQGKMEVSGDQCWREFVWEDCGCVIMYIHTHSCRRRRLLNEYTNIFYSCFLSMRLKSFASSPPQLQFF